MKDNLAVSREAVRQAGGATKYLIGVSVVLMLALTGAFSYLSHRQDKLQESIREDALWAVYQLDREARMLSHTLSEWLSVRNRDDASPATVSMRYDILYSRLSILDNSKYATTFENSNGFREHSVAIRDAVLGMEPTFNAIASGAIPPRSDLEATAAAVSTLVGGTEEFLTYTNASVSAARADARVEVMGLQQLTAAFVAALGLSILILLINLMRQIRIVKAASTQLESTAQELHLAYKAAEAGNLAKSEFMATIGHEIRTPLNAILGVGELLSESNLEAEDRENVSIILNSGNALLEIINEILDFAKLEHGDTQRDEVAFDVSELARQVVAVMDGRARDQGDTLSVNVAEAGPAWRIGDPARLRRVLLNLVSNAVKFTRDGDVTIRIRDILRAGDPALRFEIIDTGIGIPDSSLHRLFHAFSQVDGSISRRYGGTGLGLAICKKIIEGLGGEIGVDSVAGAGSTFWFEVSAPCAEPVTAVAPASDPAQRSLRQLTVLLVEDNVVNRQVAASFLGKLGQKVLTAVDGAQAVEMARDPSIDLILMDMQMPVMDGIAATRQIRGAEPVGRRVPIIAMTANASERDKMLCKDAGMDGFEAKPVPMARLAAILASLGGETGGETRIVAESTPIQHDVPSLDAGSSDFDTSRVAELVEAIGQEAYDSLADMFFHDAGSLLSDLRRAITTNDLDLFDRTLHSFKGSASNLGMCRFAGLADRLRRERLDPVAPDAIAWELDRLSLLKAPLQLPHAA